MADDHPTLAMCSRAGKSTINQYLAFSKEANKFKNFKKEDEEEEFDD